MLTDPEGLPVSEHRPLDRVLAPSLPVEPIHDWLFLLLECHCNSAVKDAFQVTELDVFPYREGAEDALGFGSVLEARVIFGDSDNDLSARIVAVIIFCGCYSLLKDSKTLLIIVIVLQLVLLSLHHVSIALALFISVVVVQQYRGVSHARSVAHLLCVLVAVFERLARLAWRLCPRFARFLSPLCNTWKAFSQLSHLDMIMEAVAFEPILIGK